MSEPASSGAPPGDPGRRQGPAMGKSVWSDTTQGLGPYLNVGLQLAAAVLVFFFLGQWLDQRYGWTPWGTIGGVVIGMVGGFVQFFRTVADIARREDVAKRHDADQ